MKQGPSFLFRFRRKFMALNGIYPWTFYSSIPAAEGFECYNQISCSLRGREAVLQPKSGYNYSNKPAFPAILISSAELLKLSFL